MPIQGPPLPLMKRVNFCQFDVDYTAQPDTKPRYQRVLSKWTTLISHYPQSIYNEMNNEAQDIQRLVGYLGLLIRVGWTL